MLALADSKESGNTMKRSQGLRVLLVGEHQEFVDSLCGFLCSDGHMVEATPDASTALASARSDLPDVVFLDWDSVGLNVLAVVKGIQLLSSWRRPFLIALAGRDNQESSHPPTDDGIDLHFLKPVNEEQVRSLLLRFQTIVRDMESFDPII